MCIFVAACLTMRWWWLAWLPSTAPHLRYRRLHWWPVPDSEWLHWVLQISMVAVQNRLDFFQQNSYCWLLSRLNLMHLAIVCGQLLGSQVLERPISIAWLCRGTPPRLTCKDPWNLWWFELVRFQVSAECCERKICSSKEPILPAQMIQLRYGSKMFLDKWPTNMGGNCYQQPLISTVSGERRAEDIEMFRISCGTPTQEKRA